MVFQPIIPGLLIILLTAGLTAVTITQFFANRVNNTKINWIFRTVIVLLLGVLMARPGVVALQEQDTYTNEYDIYFIVDSTASMVAEDWQEGTEQTRLDAAKADISKMVTEYPDARYSLITTDTKVQIRTPLTRDSVAFMSAVEYLQPEPTRYSAGSNPNLIVSELGTILEENSKISPDRATIVFLFSDGENTSDPNAQPTTETLSSSTAPDVFITAGEVLGYGTETGGKMKIQQGNFISNDPGYIQDPDTGTDALSKIDETNLQNIAESFQVPYSHRTPNEEYIAPGVEGTLNMTGTAKMNSIVDFSWVISLMILSILLVDVGFILRRAKEEVFIGKVKI